MIKSIFNQNNAYKRENAHEYMSKLRTIFINYFTEQGFIRHEEVSILDASKYDSTVRFVGSHTNVFKSYIYNNQVPKTGFCISQTCLQTQNINLYTQLDQSINNGSVFECHGLLAPFEQFHNTFLLLYHYLTEILHLSDDLKLHISSKDKEYMDILDKHQNILFEVNKIKLEELRHIFGDHRLKGRDIKCTLKSSLNGQEIPFCAFIIIELDNNPAFIEVAIAPGRIIQHIFNLEHYLDCFPLPQLQVQNQFIARKIEDCTTAIILMLHAGLVPGGTGNQRQLLRNYFRYLKHLIIQEIISLEDIKSSISFYETRMHQDKGSILNKFLEYIEKV